MKNVETTRSSSDEICSNEDSNNETNLPSQRVRHASARRLFEVNEWEEKQKRIKQKRETVKEKRSGSSPVELFALSFEKANAKPISSYEEIKASTKQLLEVKFSNETIRGKRDKIFEKKTKKFRVNHPLTLDKSSAEQNARSLCSLIDSD